MKNTAPIVRTNRTRLSRHFTGGGGGMLESRWSSLSGERVSEGGSESFELRSELGIDGSEICVQAQGPALERSVARNRRHLRHVKHRDVTLERRDVFRMGLDAHGSRALGFCERRPRELRDGLWVELDRLAQEALGEHAREVDGAIELRLGRALLAGAEREVLRRELRLLGLCRFARGVLRDALRLRARLGDDRLGGASLPPRACSTRTRALRSRRA